MVTAAAQRQRYLPIWALPSWSYDTNSALLPHDWQCSCATVSAAALGVSSGYHRKFISLGD
jgi:hypothetical protein